MKAITTSILVLLLVPTAYASLTDWLPKVYDFEEAERMEQIDYCNGSLFNETDVKRINEIPITQDFINIFGDGLHQVKLNYSFYGINESNIWIKDGTFLNAYSGPCTMNPDRTYYLPFDINQVSVEMSTNELAPLRLVYYGLLIQGVTPSELYQGFVIIYNEGVQKITEAYDGIQIQSP